MASNGEMSEERVEVAGGGKFITHGTRFMTAMIQKRLVLIAESKRRSESKAPMPALERNLGVFASVARRYLRERKAAGLPNDVAVYFVSPPRGIISADEEVGYEAPYPGSFHARPLTSDEQARIISQLNDLVGRQEFSEIYINVGQPIRQALAQADFRGRKVVFSEGSGPGPKARHMASWLRNPSSDS